MNNTTVCHAATTLYTSGLQYDLLKTNTNVRTEQLLILYLLIQGVNIGLKYFIYIHRGIRRNIVRDRRKPDVPFEKPEFYNI